jgi:hypothetical protein
MDLSRMTLCPGSLGKVSQMVAWPKSTSICVEAALASLRESMLAAPLALCSLHKEVSLAICLAKEFVQWPSSQFMTPRPTSHA